MTRCRRILSGLMMLSALAMPMPAPAGEPPAMLRAETQMPFPEAMAQLQQAIESNGYRFSRVQRVDYGLGKRGYQVPPYRIVFFGDPEEVRFLSVVRPDLIPFLPMRILIYEKQGGTVVMTTPNPLKLGELYRARQTVPVFEKWHRDLRRILQDATRDE